MLAWAARLTEPAALAAVGTEGLRRVAVNPGAGGRVAAVAALVALAADSTRRESVLRLLASLPADLIGALEQELHSSRAELRAVIVEAMARMRHPDATGTLAQALVDEHALVRGAAVAAFGRLGSPLAAAAITAMADADADPAVRRRAAAVCRRYGWNNDRARGRG
jgi:HEAT repeat protein